MSEYTYEELIINPTSEKARNYVGKEVYFSDNINICLYRANNEINSFVGVLQGITERDCYPFRVNDSYYQVIIPKKVEQKPKDEFVPFDTIEEFVKASIEHNKDHYLAGTGIWIKKETYNDAGDEYCFVMVNGCSEYDEQISISDNTWMTFKEVFDAYTFLDDTPCGKVGRVI